MTEQEQLHIFDNWLAEHRGLFFKIIRAYAFTEADREDLFQEIALQVWRSIPNFRRESAVSTWIYRVALNTSMKWSRREERHREGRQSFPPAEHLLHKKKEPENERLHWLYEEIGKLDEIDRSLCLLMLDGFSYKEMAVILGISESNVGVKIYRIKKHLIEQSEEYDHHGI